ncbi:MAG: hypothetical protein H6968_00980 [Chromatiaceae bacterium]|nr:hypothetical protein [Chromatiaceae bacterium]
MRKLIAVLLLTMGLLLLVGCETVPNNMKREVIADADLLATSHQAAEALITKAGGRLQPSRPVIAASFVNIDNLFQSSTFGRMVSQQVVTQFSNKGFTVIEMLLRKNVYIKSQSGEFLLSRELQNISAEHNAQAVIVGTYAQGSRSLFVTAKVIDAVTNIVIASHDYVLPIGPDTSYMLRN